MKNNMCSEIDKIIKGSIDSGQAVGSGCAVFRNGEELYSEAFGFADREKIFPCRRIRFSDFSPCRSL